MKYLKTFEAFIHYMAQGDVLKGDEVMDIKSSDIYIEGESEAVSDKVEKRAKKKVIKKKPIQGTPESEKEQPELAS